VVRLLVDAAWIGGAARRGVALTIDDGRIAASEAIAPPGRGWFALPGFVNAHVHLELSSVRGEELAHATFAQWIADLLAARARRGRDGIAAAVAAGARELLSTGTVAVGDVDTSGEALAVLRSTPLEGVVYRELLGLPSDAALAELEQTLVAESRPDARAGGWRLGVSPHAPYSTGEELFRRAIEWSRRLDVPIASHVAETLEEEEFLLDPERSQGPLARFFRDRALPRPVWSGERRRPFELVRSLAPPAGFCVIHGNQLSAIELAHCAESRWPVVYCPRSHRYFGHRPHPAPELLKRGGILALGTDSRASNEALDLWGEMACFRSADRAVSDAAILEAATAGGRRALRLQAAELRPGEPASFQLARARGGARVDPARFEAAAARGELETAFVFVHGRVVVGDPAALPTH